MISCDRAYFPCHRGRARLTAAALVALGLHGPVAMAQVRVRLRSDHAHYLLFEPLVIRVRVDNDGPNSLKFGGPDANARLELMAEWVPDRPVPRYEQPVVSEPIEIPPRQFHIFVVNLLDQFQLHESRPVAVAARVVTGDSEHLSGRLLLDVVPGLLIRELEVTVPGEAGLRRFELRVLSRDGREFLFLRADDPARQVCHGVWNLGTVLRVWRPQMMVDAGGVLHVLHQSAPARLTHTRYDDAERRPEMEYFSTTRLPPSLAADETGQVRVVNAAPYQGEPMLAPMRSEQAPPDRLPAPGSR